MLGQVKEKLATLPVFTGDAESEGSRRTSLPLARWVWAPDILT